MVTEMSKVLLTHKHTVLSFEESSLDLCPGRMNRAMNSFDCHSVDNQYSTLKIKCPIYVTLQDVCTV